MDIHTLRGLCTLLVLIAFIVLIIWSFSNKRKQEFDQAAVIPLADTHSNKQPNLKDNKKNNLTTRSIRND